MCCKNSTGKIIPFLITFAIGIFAAGLFYGWTNSNSVNKNRLEKGTNHTRTSCGFERMKRHHDIMELVPPVPVSPAPIAPKAEVFIKKVAPKTIVLREDLNQKNK